MDNCIFCKIIRGEIPSAKVYEDENFLAFLSINPINPGHTLVIPKKHVEYLFDMEDEDLGNIMKICKRVARALEKSFQPATGKIGIMVAGLEVSHTHIHLIPMNSEKDLNFEKAQSVTPEELSRNAEIIKEALL